MTVLDIVRVLGGLGILVAGGELLVRGASALARRLGLSSLVIGLTVVAVSTSAPELAVTVDAVIRSRPEIAVGNVVGSNIANVLLVLGLTAVVGAVLVRRSMLRFDLPFLAGCGLALLVVSLDGTINRLEAVGLLCLFILHTTLSVIRGRRQHDPGEPEEGVPGTGSEASRENHTEPADSSNASSLPRSLAFLLVGVGLLVLGANLLVAGAVAIATAFGVSELVIGLTVVAVGTSLPELAASVIAARRGEREIALGNVVGSSIANIGLVLGLPAMFASGIPVPGGAIAFDIPVMLAASVLLIPLAFTGSLIGRVEGFLLLLLYTAYTGYVILLAAEHDALHGVTWVMAGFVLPPMLIVIAVHAVREARARRRADLPLTGERS